MFCCNINNSLLHYLQQFFRVISRDFGKERAGIRIKKNTAKKNEKLSLDSK